MIIKNCKIIFKDGIKNGSILIKDGKISKINPKKYDDEIIDAKGLYLSPGFIDVHIHGAGGYDTMDGTSYSINTISKIIMKHGTTSFLPTTMTMSIGDINKTLRVIKSVKEEGSLGANVLGAHLEGPFINLDAVGAQNFKYILKPSIEEYKKMVDGCEDVVTSITLAPEVKGANELIEYISKKGIICSVGHTKATYEDIIKSIKYGVSHSTHLYNAMSGFNHREPGVVGAIFDSDIKTEIICDGIHVSYPALRIAFKIKSTDNVLLVSDAMRACCMEDGKYELGNQDVYVKSGVARLENGALAGSVLTLDKAIKNVHEHCNIPLHEVVKMATYNPAKHCKVDTHKGLIKEGYDADLVLFDENINIKRVFINGEEKLKK